MDAALRGDAELKLAHHFHHAVSFLTIILLCANKIIEQK